ncbi:MFS transporter [Luteimonas mephitis]|uniref:MFS transporter n=1 Tax=Luteimonas mephitis TaxID=83615 RepID=UPI0004003DEA|nr:MFS transporter [Luteimonas mephitis]
MYAPPPSDPPADGFGAIRAAACVAAFVTMLALDGINSTLLVVNRGAVAGSFAAIPDEIAWLNIAYLAAKITAFALSPRLAERFGPWRVLLAASLGLALATAALGLTADAFWSAVACRVAQGALGGLLLVTGQSLVFALQPTRRQPLLQALLALPIVVLPTTIAPALHGWSTDAHAWQLLFLLSGAIGMLGSGVLAIAGGQDRPDRSTRLPGAGVCVLLALATTGFVYVLQKGARYDWFDDPDFVDACLWTLLAFAGLVLALARSKAPLFSTAVFRDARFSFGFCATFAAGFVLFGSASAISLFAANVLQLAPVHVGQITLSSSIMVALGLLSAGLVIQYTRARVELPIPVGIVLFMTGMWLLSHATPDSGRSELAVATWCRGLGMGALFMSLTMLTLGHVKQGLKAHGVALFNLGRQVGGLAGSAFVLSWLEWRVPAHMTVLSQYLVAGRPAVETSRAALASALVAHGVDASQGPVAALAVLARALGRQSAARAFDELFLGLGAFFLVAIPVLVAIRIVLERAQRRRSQPA